MFEYNSVLISFDSQEYSTDKKLSTTSLWKNVGITVSFTSLRVTVNGNNVLQEDLTGPQQQHDYTELKVTAGGKHYVETQ